MINMKTANLMRYAGALAVLAVGIDHIVEYYAYDYRALPTIGTLFLLNFLGAMVIGLALLAPIRRFRKPLAAGGITLGVGTLAGLLVSEKVGLFGFVEYGYRSSIVLSMGFDIAAAVFLAAFLVLHRASTNAGVAHAAAR
jgi:hypothetical protein